jgi:hypothetical protein
LTTSDDLSNEKAEETKDINLKKYNVHGKVEKDRESDKIEVSYYECDRIICNRIIIKKEEKLR